MNNVVLKHAEMNGQRERGERKEREGERRVKNETIRGKRLQK